MKDILKVMKFHSIVWLAVAMATGGAFADMAEKKPIEAVVRPHGGMPTLWIDGRPQTGLMYWSPDFAFEKDVEVMRTAGVHLYTTGCSRDLTVEDPERAAAIMDEKIARVVAIDPSALFLVRLVSKMPENWLTEHPDSPVVRTYSVADATFRDKTWVSPASGEWMAVHVAAMRRLVRHCETKWPDRVLGYHPGVAHCGENAYEWGQGIGDFSAAQVARFGRPVPAVTNYVAQTPLDRRRLLDPVRERDHIAFLQHQSRVMAQAVCDMARGIKSELSALGRRKICCVFYGYEVHAVNSVTVFSCGHHAQDIVYRSPDIDCIAGPLDYSSRQLGGAVGPQMMSASVALNGKLCYGEEDTRFHRADPRERHADTPAEMRDLLLRDFFETFSHGGTCWWMDLPGTGWYCDDAFVAPIAACRRFAESHLARRESVAEIAVFADNGAVAHERIAPLPLSNELVAGMMPELAACGAPFDGFHLFDLETLAKGGRLAQYKLAVVLNAHSIGRETRAAIGRHLCRDGRTVLFLGPAGWNAEGTAGAENVCALTGIRVLERPSTQSGRVEAFLDGRRVTFGSPVGSDPSFVLADEAMVPLGWYVSSRDRVCEKALWGVALAEKAMPGWKSVLCAVNMVPSDVLRHFAEAAGVHVYSPHGDQVFAGPGWFAVAAKMPGRHRFASRTGTSVDVDLPRGAFVVYDDAGIECLAPSK